MPSIGLLFFFFVSLFLYSSVPFVPSFLPSLSVPLLPGILSAAHYRTHASSPSSSSSLSLVLVLLCRLYISYLFTPSTFFNSSPLPPSSIHPSFLIPLHPSSPSSLQPLLIHTNTNTNTTSSSSFPNSLSPLSPSLLITWPLPQSTPWTRLHKSTTQVPPTTYPSLPPCTLIPFLFLSPLFTPCPLVYLSCVGSNRSYNTIVDLNAHLPSSYRLFSSLSLPLVLMQ